jgi:hypothetical protein
MSAVEVAAGLLSRCWPRPIPWLRLARAPYPAFLYSGRFGVPEGGSGIPKLEVRLVGGGFSLTMRGCSAGRGGARKLIFSNVKGAKLVKIFKFQKKSMEI